MKNLLINIKKSNKEFSLNKIYIKIEQVTAQ